MGKKIFNNPEDIVNEMIEGIEAAYGRFYAKIPEVNGVAARTIKKNKVALVVGGGSGHEPMFIGFVGKGLADAAACGPLYTSPDPETIYKTAKYVDQGKGVLLVYGAYPGDILNFDIGEEMLNADGISTAHVRVHDDVASAPVGAKEERRGIAGDVLVFKIAGAACEAGLNLREATRITRKASANVRSVGIGTNLSRTIGFGKYVVGGNEDEIEYGVGLHGERGVLKTGMQSADILTERMYNQIMDEQIIHPGDEVVVLVNGLGSTSIAELAIVYRKLKQLLDNDGINVYDADFNTYFTSQGMGGFSISIMLLDSELKEYYDKPCLSPFYTKDGKNKSGYAAASNKAANAAAKPAAKQKHDYKPVVFTGELNKLDALLTRDMMIYVAEKLIDAEDYLNDLDAEAGDGDHGVGIASGMRKVKSRLETLDSSESVREILEITGKTLLTTMGGAAGVFFGNMFLGFASTLGPADKFISKKNIANMFAGGLAAVKKRGKAQVGDKTIVDAIQPAVEAFENCTSKTTLVAAFKCAEEAAYKSTLETKNYVARYGRGKYLQSRALGCQDPGATSIWLIIKAMREFAEGKKERD